MSVASIFANDLAAAVDAKPIEISKFWANRGGEAIVVQLKQYHGRWFLDCRRNCTDKNGLFVPTAKGLMIGVSKLQELKKAIARAETEARKQGLISE